ncbi:hypothetical protein [Sphingobium yanoikuyae]|uniref:hypothetical protein n=1 Tax=Sphingobium yanoikuyae TaxID=13690 RepID=UPI0028AC1102|nr:hypothetical protein [Sphingobium yanoikuyae]
MARHQRQWILSDPHTAVHDAIAFLDRCAIRCRGYRFWLFLLRRRPLAQLLQILVEDTDRGRELRKSNPFFGPPHFQSENVRRRTYKLAKANARRKSAF